MNSSTKKGSSASVVAAIPDAQLTKDRGQIIPKESGDEKYLKQHPLNVNATFNKRPSLL